MHYSPVRHSSAPEGLLPSDLHVLSIPPAFNLSHDQTLQFNIMRAPFKMGRQSFPVGLRRPVESTGLLCQPLSSDTGFRTSTHTHCLGFLVKELRNFRCAESDYSTDLLGRVKSIYTEKSNFNAN